MDPNLKVRPNPIVAKIDTPEFQSIFSDNLNDLIKLFEKYNYELRIAGGAVRDLLLGKSPKDIDFATTATPNEMKTMFTTENIRMINMNGEAHGTITPRINDAENFEITTLRIDVQTDGRHAKVEFTTDWLLDANRRDLTINSMFLGFDGSVFDYFYGYEDLLSKRVRFVGNADYRIKEDFLRILRYFRFYGRIADKPNEHDENTLCAIKENINGLEKISGERIWVELKKILEGNFHCELVTKIIECGGAKYIGLPNEPNIEEFHIICATSKSCEIPLRPISLLSAFLSSPQDALNLHQRLKLSAYERDLALFLTQNKINATNVNDLRKYKLMCLNTIQNRKLTKEFIMELLKYHNKMKLYDELAGWQIPTFPVNGNALIINGCPKGAAVGQVMIKLKELWAENDFQLNAEELLKQLPTILCELNFNDPPKRPKFK